MRNVYLVTFLGVVLLVSILGFRGTTFTKPPADVFPEWAFPGMKYQPKLRPQSASPFFADGQADRLPPAKTVARGLLHEDDHLYRGKDASGQFVNGFPEQLTVDLAFLQRGQQRYDTFCAPCHGLTGFGDGILARYGMGTLPGNGNYHTDRLRAMTDGQIYDTITNGSQSKVMFPYADKLVPEDRWAVVAYVRALQRAQQGTAADVADPVAKQNLGIQ